MRDYTGATTVVIAVLAQGAAVIWSVSTIVSDVEDTREDVRQMSSRMSSYERDLHEVELVVTRIDANLEAIRGAIDIMVAAR
jgi:hypothetical protein|tara:strand:+ start:147 stop:392 length:246 start_codon:yes stop_codon:yes gene_type:complete